MARDQSKFMGVEENTFDRGEGKAEVEEVLQRYDQKKTYYIRSVGVYVKGNQLMRIFFCCLQRFGRRCPLYFNGQQWTPGPIVGLA